MVDPTYEIHAWRKSGPAYTKKTYNEGFSNRNNRWTEESVGSKGGPSIDTPEYYLLEADGGVEKWAFNKGHSYGVEVIVDGEHETLIVVDATDDYQVVSTPDGVEIVEISPQSLEPVPFDDKTSDDEDAPVEKDDSDEEE